MPFATKLSDVEGVSINGHDWADLETNDGEREMGSEEAMLKCGALIMGRLVDRFKKTKQLCNRVMRMTDREDTYIISVTALDTDDGTVEHHVHVKIQDEGIDLALHSGGYNCPCFESELLLSPTTLFASDVSAYGAEEEEPLEFFVLEMLDGICDYIAEANASIVASAAGSDEDDEEIVKLLGGIETGSIIKGSPDAEKTLAASEVFSGEKA
jgi:hypothetical protein